MLFINASILIYNLVSKILCLTTQCVAYFDELKQFTKMSTLQILQIFVIFCVISKRYLLEYLLDARLQITIKNNSYIQKE